MKAKSSHVYIYREFQRVLILACLEVICCGDETRRDETRRDETRGSRRRALVAACTCGPRFVCWSSVSPPPWALAPIQARACNGIVIQQSTFIQRLLTAAHKQGHAGRRRSFKLEFVNSYTRDVVLVLEWRLRNACCFGSQHTDSPVLRTKCAQR